MEKMPLNEKDLEVISSYLNMTERDLEYLKVLTKLDDGIYAGVREISGMFRDLASIQIVFDKNTCSILTNVSDTWEMEVKAGVETNMQVVTREDVFTYGNGQVSWITSKNSWMSHYGDDMFPAANYISRNVENYRKYEKPSKLHVISTKIAETNTVDPYTDISEFQFMDVNSIEEAKRTK